MSNPFFAVFHFVLLVSLYGKIFSDLNFFDPFVPIFRILFSMYIVLLLKSKTVRLPRYQMGFYLCPGENIILLST